MTTPRLTKAWRLKRGEATAADVTEGPLFPGYRMLLDSNVAYINDISSGAFGGAITAALYLKEFVPDDVPLAPFDMMARNNANRPDQPEGGEAQVPRADAAVDGGAAGTSRSHTRLLVDRSIVHDAHDRHTAGSWASASRWSTPMPSEAINLRGGFHAIAISMSSLLARLSRVRKSIGPSPRFEDLASQNAIGVAADFGDGFRHGVSGRHSAARSRRSPRGKCRRSR